MSYRLTQLSPQSTENKLRVIVSHSWSTAPENFREMQFWRSWLELDSDLEREVPRSRFNWSLVCGFVVALGVSAAFWFGLGSLIARLLR